jgi:uncharacterized membrane protein (Fun14 family)
VPTLSLDPLALMHLIIDRSARSFERPGDLLQATTTSDDHVPSPSVDPAGLFNETFFLKLGFSFMVGLALGFALKVAFKVVLLVAGLILLGVFALQYAGILAVNWSGLEVHYNGWVDWFGANAGAFFDFIGSNLTSAASFMAGLVMGLKL